MFIQKNLSEPKYIDTDIVNSILEAVENKNSTDELQRKLNSVIFGVPVLRVENLQQFKDTFAEFDIERLSIL